MVLNPDVVVRSRGVMEKCSMCIQMTQKTILDAKRDGRAVSRMMNSRQLVLLLVKPELLSLVILMITSDEIFKLKHDTIRGYHLLEAVGTKPNVVYQAQVRNTSEA